MLKITKGRHNVTIDDHIWNLAGKELDISRSEFIERQLRAYLGEDDELSVLMKEETRLLNKLNVVQTKICSIRERKHEEKISEHIFDKPMEIIYRIHNEMGYIGRNQITAIANRNDIPKTELIEHCKKQGLNIENYGELPKKR